MFFDKNGVVQKTVDIKISEDGKLVVAETANGVTLFTYFNKAWSGLTLDLIWPWTHFYDLILLERETEINTERKLKLSNGFQCCIIKLNSIIW